LAAKAEIEAAERAARLELKVITANLAVDGAESLLEKELTPAEAQETLVAAFVKSLEGSRIEVRDLQYANALADIGIAQKPEEVTQQLTGFGACTRMAELRNFLASRQWRAKQSIG